MEEVTRGLPESPARRAVGIARVGARYGFGFVEESGVFSLNFLDTEQEELAKKFTRSLKPGEGAVGGSPYSTGETGAPLFEEAFAYLECRVAGEMEAGDHTIYLGKVVASNLKRPAGILTDLDTHMQYDG